MEILVISALTVIWGLYGFPYLKDFLDVDLGRWQPSKTTKEDADDEIAKYDGL